jgi:putative nucleotidyltransferase with HDIG domain
MYRVRQFVRALRPTVRRETSALCAEHLAPAEEALFRRMAVYDQEHAALVLSRVTMARGEVAPELAQAALLHDVGKAGDTPVRLPQRVALVLAEAVAPWLLRGVEDAEPGDWRYPMSIAMRHAARGADMLRSAGAPERVVELVRRHHDCLGEDTDDDWLRALQAADQSS